MKLGQGLLLALALLNLHAAWPCRSAPAGLRLVACYPQDAALAEAVGGDHVQVTSLARPQQDPHRVTPKPSMAVALNQADLLIVNGQDMDYAWLPTALSMARNPRILDGEDGYFDPSAGALLVPYGCHDLDDTIFGRLNRITAPETAGEALDTAGYRRGHHHYWLDPENGITVAQNIARELAERDGENAGDYTRGARKLEETMRGKMRDWDAEMAPLKGTAVACFHRDWTYLAAHHGLRVVGYVEPREEVLPDESEIRALVRAMKKEHARVLLSSPWQYQHLAQQVARMAGAVNVVLPSTVDPQAGIKDYTELFAVIYARLVPALRS